MRAVCINRVVSGIPRASLVAVGAEEEEVDMMDTKGKWIDPFEMNFASKCFGRVICASIFAIDVIEVYCSASDPGKDGSWLAV